MSKQDKRLNKIRNNPRNVSYEELRTILESYGFTFRDGKGSHTVYTHELFDASEEETLPRQNPLKPIYVKIALNNIDRVK